MHTPLQDPGDHSNPSCCSGGNHNVITTDGTGIQTRFLLTNGVWHANGNETACCQAQLRTHAMLTISEM